MLVLPSSSEGEVFSASSCSVSASNCGLMALLIRPRVRVMERVIGANIAADSLSLL